MKKYLLYFLSALSVSATTFALPQQQHLQLTSMCSDDPTVALRWRVRNNNSYPITYTWKIVDGGPTAPTSISCGGGVPYVAQPGDNFFFSPRWYTGNNVMVIYVNNVEQNGGRKASGKQSCAIKNFDVFVSCKKQVDACTWLVTFGYYNDNANTTFTIPHGLDNHFTGGDIIRGESDTVFYPGTHNDAFKVRIACNTTIVWHLTGPFGPKSVNSTAPFVNQCEESIKPFVNCISWDATKAGEMTVTYGYENTGTDTVNIPVGTDNVFADHVWGTPITQFLPGVHHNVCTANFNGNSMKWHLKDYNNQTHDVMAYNEYVGQCVEALKPHVNCIKHNNDGSTTAYFNYENLGSGNQTIYHGARNYLVGEAVTVNQTETFIPGYKENAFNATFTGAELKWVLTGPDGVTRYAIANDEYCKVCDNNSKVNGDDEHFIRQIHPNPSCGKTTLEIENKNFTGENYTVSVCDMYGKKLYSAEYTSDITSVDVDLTKFIKGIYTIHVQCDKENDTVRLIRQ